jgi:hypothetical protein
MKNWEKRYILANIITILLFPIAAMCRSTWREENKIYILHSFKSYKSRFNNHFQYFISKKKLFNKYYHCSSFPNRCHLQMTRIKEVIIYDLLSFDFIYVLGFKCYLYENLELIIIFCTLLQKNKYLKRCILANIIIVLLFFSQSRWFADLKIAAIERRRIMGPWFG